MTAWVDLVDGVRGYPFEVASPAAIAEFYRLRGFEETRLIRRTGIGCNEFVFRRSAGRQVKT